MKIHYNLFSAAFVIIVLLLINSCEKKPTDYRDYLNGAEKVYPGGVVSGIEVRPGNHRVLINWIPNPDPSVVKYILFWNNGTDSIIVEDMSYHKLDTVKTYIDNLEEGLYNFEVYFYNATGDRSIPTTIPNVRVFGNKYRGSLLNRAVSEINYTDDGLAISWSVPDTINVFTEIRYISTLDEVKSIYLSPEINNLVLSDWKLPTTIYYKSSYKPQSNAIDTFAVEYYDSLIVSNLPVDKSTWSAALLPGDAAVNAFGTSLEKIWDGQPGNHPDMYHSDGATIPHTFTIDLGQTYNQLTQFGQWGRADCACSNPDHFEVWGIADTTAATTMLPASDAGWKAESIAKGWTLLSEVKRTDDGISGITQAIIDNPPPVRFIRIRVLHNVGNTKFSHMSEISFWYNP